MNDVIPAADAPQAASAPDAPRPHLRLFPRLPGETPRAFTAFTVYFGLGHNRSLQAVCDQLDEGLSTVKAWSAKHRWQERIQNYNSGLLEQHAQAQAALEKKIAADWAGRLNSLREQEWEAAEKLFSAAQCFLESYGDDDLSKMTLAQVSRAISISSKVGRSALIGVELPPSTESALAPIQIEMLEAARRAYGHLDPNDGKDAISQSSKALLAKEDASPIGATACGKDAVPPIPTPAAPGMHIPNLFPPYNPPAAATHPNPDFTPVQTN